MLYGLDELSLDDIHEEWRKSVFGSEYKYKYDVNSLNDMNHIHDNKVNNIAEWNLLHDILNTPKCTKNINRHCSLILHGCMNTRRGKSLFDNFLILLDSDCSSTVVMRRHEEWCESVFEI